ncbi:MAG: LPS-assembly protein LptD [Candidatus Cloacimonetes bacterium]|nr:LPS-assembly protein LptD [Candidatus Cloacimonadota bacterium]
MPIMKKAFLCTDGWWLLLAAICILGLPLFAEDARISVPEVAIADSLQTSSALDSLFYAADSIYYGLDVNRIVLAGDATVTYHTSTITADTIVVDIKREQAFTKGQSLLKDSAQNLIGEEIFFDLNTKWGLVRAGASQFEKGFYYGEEIRKVDDKVFDIDNGIFTTCDAPHPHWYIKTWKLRLYQKDKIVAKPLFFYVNDFPVMAFPFGTFSIKRGRNSGILVPSPGYNKNDGKFVENIAVYYAWKDFYDTTLSLDYYEKTGWKLGFVNRYIKRYVFNGKFNSYLRKTRITPQHSIYDWNIVARHRHNFTNNTSFDADLNFVSSKQIFQGDENIDDRLKEKVTSSMSFKTPFLGSRLSVYATYVDDLENDRKDITLPSISYTMSSKPIYELFMKKDDEIPEDAWWKNFSCSYSFKGVHVGDINQPHATWQDVFFETTQDSSGVWVNQHNAGILHSAGLRYSYKVKGWLNLTQSLSGKEAWFDRDKNDKKWVRAMDYNTSSRISFSLYGLRKINNWYLKAVRHILSPSISFTYKPDFTDNRDYYSFSGIGVNASGRQRKVAITLVNKWQVKLNEWGKLKERKLNNFFTITSTCNYDFEREGDKLSSLSHSLDFNPNGIKAGPVSLSVSPSGSIVQDPHHISLHRIFSYGDYGVDRWRFNLSSKLTLGGDASYFDYFPQRKNRFVSNRFLEQDSLATEEDRTITTLADLEALQTSKKNWNLSFTHSYKTDDISYENHSYTSDLRMAFSAKITRNWSVQYDNYINLREKDIVSHNVTLTRDLHCWKIIFRYTQQGEYWNYKFQLFNIVLPDDLKFETTDHK